MCINKNWFFRWFQNDNEVSNTVEDDVMDILNNNLQNYKILLDNGHGNNTLGKRSPYSSNKITPEIEFYEYKWNREIVELIYNRLTYLGYNVSILVEECNDISLSERVRRINEFCGEYGNDNVLAVSVHSNACGNGSKWENAKGWEAYTSIGQTESDKLSEIFYKNAEEIFYDRKIRYDLSDGDKDKEENFTIIKNSCCPAILTENFFYDNVDDVQFILSEDGKNRIVELHVKSIIEYIEKKVAL